jgi:hypothetical protein
MTPIYPVPCSETAGAYTVTFRYSNEICPSEIVPAGSPTDEGTQEKQRRQTPNIIKTIWFFIVLPQINLGLILHHIQIFCCCIVVLSPGVFTSEFLKISHDASPIFLSRFTGYPLSFITIHSTVFREIC